MTTATNDADAGVDRDGAVAAGGEAANDRSAAAHLARNLAGLRHARSLTQDALARGAAMSGTPHLPGTREFFTCLDGRVNLMVTDERHAIATGDVLAFPGNLPHSHQNADALAPARAVSVVVFAKAGV